MYGKRDRHRINSVSLLSIIVKIVSDSDDFVAFWRSGRVHVYVLFPFRPPLKIRTVPVNRQEKQTARQHRC